MNDYYHVDSMAVSPGGFVSDDYPIGREKFAGIEVYLKDRWDKGWEFMGVIQFPRPYRYSQCHFIFRVRSSE